MRTIQFRFWHDVFKEYVKEPQVYMMLNCDGEFEEILTNGAFIIEQYTGINDSEGVKIYEGDILESVFDNQRKIAPVRFEEGCFIVDTVPLYVEADFTCKVIGNIHQNKNLI